MIHETNLVIEVRDATLDVARDNIDCLMKHIQLIREQWDIILQETKLVAQSEGISSEIPLSRYLSTQPDAEQHYKVKVFITIIDSILSVLSSVVIQLTETYLHPIWVPMAVQYPE